MNCTPITTTTARKPHKCTWCGEQINGGDVYKQWTSFGDIVFKNKMHPECDTARNDEYIELGTNEYTPFDNDRPTGSTGK